MTRTSFLTEHLAVHPYAILDVTDLISQSDWYIPIGMTTGPGSLDGFSEARSP